MTEQETTEDHEGEYIDFSNAGEVDKALTKAFKEYAWPKLLGSERKDWVRRGRRLEPRKKDVSERDTTRFKLERVKKILALSARGFPVYQIAPIVGVTERMIYKWVQRGEKEGQGPYWVFARALEQLCAAYEARLQGVVHAFTFKGGKVPTEAEAEMALKQLTRRFPKQWGQQALDVTSNGKSINGGTAKTTKVVISYMRPGKDGKPELAAPPEAQEQSVFDDG